MILVDTSVLYAGIDRGDTHHDLCRSWLDAPLDALVLPPTVLAEVCYLVDRAIGPEAEAAFLDDVGTTDEAPYQLVDLAGADLARMSQLVRQYADRRLGGTDASIVAVCERLGITTVATLNHRDFTNVRPRHTAAFSIVP
ncbi:MAG: type II toxin-antitoxin system VapC family toxin [Kineosporiaceae bacterium]